jgi:undecaprenyl diphosphate synthase
VCAAVRAARELGIRHLTLYAFSAQNWERPAAEVAALMRLLLRFVHEERAELAARGIRLTALGDLARLPALARGPLAALIEATRANRGMTLCLALSWRARVAGARRAAAAHAAVAGACAGSDLNDVARALDTRALPRPVIRTSEQRLSNFLLWEAAYAELYFTDVMWPDFGRDELEAACAAFARRQRRFGRLAESVA